MIAINAPAPAEPTLSEKISALAQQASAWVQHNIVDLIIAIGFAAVIALVLLAMRGFGQRLLRERAGQLGWRTVFAKVLARTSILLIIACSAELVAHHAATPPPLLRAINFLFVIAAAVQAAVWARELIIGYIEHRVGEEAPHGTLGSAMSLIRVLVTFALFSIALILILSNLGVNVTGLVAGLGIGGIAIGLAAQGIFSDLFAALSIIFDKPFRRGDAISFDQQTGTVEQIGLKTTRIRSVNGEQVIVSNAKLLEKQLHNYTNLQHRRFVVALGLVYQTAPEVLERIPEMLKSLVDAHPGVTFVRCGMVRFGASSLDFELQFDVHTTDYELAFETRNDIFLDILRQFRAADIEFAYPTQTSFTAAPDGTFVMPYPPVEASAQD